MVESLTRQSKIRSYWITPGRGSDITPETLKEAICRVFGTEPDKLLGKDRDEATADAKHFYRWFLDKYYNMSDPSIAMLSNCSRSNVLCSVKKASELMEVDKNFQDKAGQIIDKWEAGLIQLVDPDRRPTLEDTICSRLNSKREDLNRIWGNSQQPNVSKFMYRLILRESGVSIRQMSTKLGIGLNRVLRNLRLAQSFMGDHPEYNEIYNEILKEVKTGQIRIEIMKEGEHPTNQIEHKAQQIREQYERYYPNEK